MSFLPRFMFIVLVLLACQAASVLNMRERINQMQILPLDYWANHITISNRDVMIVRGAYVSGDAWGGDTYLVLMKQGNKWQLARPEMGARDNTLIAEVPHTYEDGVVSIDFLIPKGGNSSKTASDLYLLETARHYRSSPIEPVPAVFTLYVLSRENDDLGVLHLRKLQTETSTARYCSANLAAYRELGIPLPGAPYPRNEQSYACP